MKFIRTYWHFLILILFCLTPVIWFWGKPDILITGLDTNFPLDPQVWFNRRFFVWNDVFNMGSDFSSSLSGIFFHLIQYIPYVMGLTLQGVNIVSLIFWFSAVVLSAYFLVKTILPASKLSQVVFVLLYAFNIYLFNTWENVKVSNISLYIALPFFLAVIYQLFIKQISCRKAFILSFVGSIFASGAGINPAYFLALLGGMFLFFVVLHLHSTRLQSLGSTIKEFFVIFGTLFFTNIFWVLPLANNLYHQNIFNLEALGLTDWLDSLSQNTSLVNVIRLQGAWDWYSLDIAGMPIYIPYALNYFYRLPFIVFSFVTPILAVCSLIFIKKDKIFWYVALALFMLLGIFLSCGGHPPTGEIYKLLVRKIPFFSFFRSPWYIFSPYLILAYAGLVALLVSRFEQTVTGINKYIFWGLTGVFALSHLLYSYPLVQGKIFRPGRSDSFYVKFPSYVWDMKNFIKLSVNLGSGRIFSYPDDQLEAFNWGYRGTESILNLFSDKEVIGPTFNISSNFLQNLQEQIYFYLKSGEYETALSYLPFLGADKLFVKKDVSSISPPILDKLGNLVQFFSIGPWSINLAKDVDSSKLFVASYVFASSGSINNSIQIIPFLPKRSVVVDKADSEFAKSGLGTKTLDYLEFDNTIELANRYSNKRILKANIAQKGIYKIVLETKGLKNSDILLKLDLISVPVDQIRTENSFFVVGPFNLDKGEHSLDIQYPPLNNLIHFGNFKEQNRVLNLQPEELPQDLNNVLVAYSDATYERKIEWKMSNFNPFINYVFEYDYKYVYGSVSFLEPVQYAPTSPLLTLTQVVGASLDWDHKDFVIKPVPANSNLDVLLKLPANKSGDKSKTFIQNLSIKRFYDNRAFLIAEGERNNLMPEGNFTYVQKSPVKYKVEVQDNAGGGLFLTFLETYNNGWSIKPVGGKFKIAPLHFKVNGYANGWYIKDASGIKELEIYYLPQNLFNVGLGVFSLEFLMVVIACFKKDDFQKKVN